MEADLIFQDVQRSLERRSGVYRSRLEIGDRLIELQSMSGDFHERIMKAFLHIRCLSDSGNSQSKTPDLTIVFWDEQATCWNTPPYDESMSSGSRMIFRDGKSRFAWDTDSRCWTTYNSITKRGYWQVPRLTSVEAHEFAAPFRKIFHWWSSDLGMQLVHAAAVGRSEGGVLLVGRGGSGKSTSALSVLGHDLMFAGDDYCLVSLDGNPRVFSLYGTGKLDAQSASKLPLLEQSFHASDLRIQDKAVICAAQIFPESMIHQMPLRAIVVPNIAHHREPQLSRISGAEALRAVAPSTLLQMPGERALAMSRLADLNQCRPIVHWDDDRNGRFIHGTSRSRTSDSSSA